MAYSLYIISIQIAVLTSTSGSLFPDGFLWWVSFGSVKLTKTPDLSSRGVLKRESSTISTVWVEKITLIHPDLTCKGRNNLTLL